MPEMPANDGPRRVAIENLRPALDDGRFAVKRVVGERLPITADIFADGHDVVCAMLLTRKAGEAAWRESPLAALGNDAWQAELDMPEAGRYEYTVEGWVDAFETWRRDLEKRQEAGQDVAIDLAIGGQLVAEAAARARGVDAKRLGEWARRLNAGFSNVKNPSPPAPLQQGERGGSTSPSLSGDELRGLAELMSRYPDRSLATRHEPLAVVVDPPRAQFSTWYEVFPRSCSRQPGKHGTLADCIDWLPRLAEMGFDVLYLPPIHPVGAAFRKGKNNALVAETGDVGSPWAIGAADGGHTAIERQLGTLDDFRRLVGAARHRGIDIALDIAFQCSPDHPYVREHPQWFRARPDGTIQYAENPPKKYQDIYPFDFQSSDWRALWRELTEVVLYWCQQGVRVFRVDNPHTKPFAFWEYLIGEVKARHPETIFLSEAFTRPKLMYHLAKLGFSQSYTYFTWRNSKAELTEYFTELSQPELRQYFRPNLWPNTPDILPDHLQTGGRAAFVTRLILAGTLSSNYGIYGPAYEAMEHEPREPGSEEYHNSEKYELRTWDLDRPENLREVITRVNRARRENRAFQSDARLEFHPTDNEQLLCYSKHNAERTNWIVVVVNLDFHNEQHGYIELPLARFGLSPAEPYQVQDLLRGETYTWQGAKNFVELDPQKGIAHILRLLPTG